MPTKHSAPNPASNPNAEGSGIAETAAIPELIACESLHESTSQTAIPDNAWEARGLKAKFEELNRPFNPALDQKVDESLRKILVPESPAVIANVKTPDST